MPEVFTQNDYINAGRLQHKISHLRKLIGSQIMSIERLCYRLDALNMVESVIDAQPKADVKRVRHGRWVVNDRNPDYADCTNCGLSEWLGANGSRDYAETLLSGFKKYCPNCGARMDAADDQGGGAENAVT